VTGSASHSCKDELETDRRVGGSCVSATKLKATDIRGDQECIGDRGSSHEKLDDELVRRGPARSRLDERPGDASRRDDITRHSHRELLSIMARDGITHPGIHHDARVLLVVSRRPQSKQECSHGS